VDLFSGAGGMSLGFEQAGFDVVAAVDSDPIHLAVHSFNFPNTEALCHDIATLQAEQVQAVVRKGWSAHGHEGEWDGTIDCLFGGPSCQGFSVMGRLTKGDERNDLVFQFARLVADLRPSTFVMENVPGLTHPRYASDLTRLLNRFTEAGYTVNRGRPMRLDAADFGVPQHRSRIFIDRPEGSSFFRCAGRTHGPNRIRSRPKSPLCFKS
jgi:DNA (cytosine-5)-methyltransferase 1